MIEISYKAQNYFIKKRWPIVRYSAFVANLQSVTATRFSAATALRKVVSCFKILSDKARMRKLKVDLFMRKFSRHSVSLKVWYAYSHHSPGLIFIQMVRSAGIVDVSITAERSIICSILCCHWIIRKLEYILCNSRIFRRNLARRIRFRQRFTCNIPTNSSMMMMLAANFVMMLLWKRAYDLVRYHFRVTVTSG